VLENVGVKLIERRLQIAALVAAVTLHSAPRSPAHAYYNHDAVESRGMMVEPISLNGSIIT
jgi:hypothetical protein